MKAVIIYSGGMDSMTLLHEHKNSIKLALSFDYGSNHNDREYAMAVLNTKELGIPHIRLDMKEIFKSFKSTLLDGAAAIPEGHYESENMKQTVVPFRNGIMLSIAGGIAASQGLDAVLLGVHGGDHAIYPDCRSSFIHEMANTLRQGLWEKVTIMAPYLYIDKRKIALLGQKLGLDYAKSYTCYKGGEKHCGKCGACQERKMALEGFDTTIYER